MESLFTFAELKALKHKQCREQTGLFTAEGEKFIAEIPSELISAFVISKAYADKHKGFEQTAACPVITLKDSLFAALSVNKAPQGRIAVCKKPNIDIGKAIKKCVNGFSVLCDGIADPGNLGCIIRSAYAFGAAAVFLSEGTAEAFAPKTLQSAAGAVFHIPVLEKQNLEQTVITFKNNGVGVAAAMPQNANPLGETQLKIPAAVILGTEARGISDKLAALCTERLYIPMPGGAQSLNVAASAAIFLYEFSRLKYF